MDLSKNGKLLCDLRKARGMTQKQVAEKLGIVPKTVSKWETGNGFPDVSTVSALADILGVSEKAILSGSLEENFKEAGDMKKIKFYVCTHCESFMQGNGECQVFCCSKPLEPLKPESADIEHAVNVSEIENDFYIEFEHEMTKEHYIKFVSYVIFDKVLTARLYPEQDATVRFPKMHGGRLYCFCTKHGLFEYQMKSCRKA